MVTRWQRPLMSPILVVALIVFGPGKLPEVGKSLGKGIGELKQAISSEPVKEKIVMNQGVLPEKKVDETKEKA